jgi:hypothetical protein
MRDARSTRTATALQVLNTALLVGLGASLAIVAPEIRARLVPRQPTVTGTTTAPPRPAPLETPRRRELSLERPLRGGDAVSRVITNNSGMLMGCYHRALLRDDSIGTGKVTIEMTVGFSGRVTHVGVDAAPRLRPMAPCLRESLSRWAFPYAPERHAVEFAFHVS